MARKKFKEDEIILPEWLSNILLYGLAAYLVYLLVPSVAEYGFITVIGFLFSCGLSFYRKVVLRDPRVVAVIAIGYMLSSVATKSLLTEVYNNILSSLFLNAIIIAIVYFYIRKKSQELISSGTQ